MIEVFKWVKGIKKRNINQVLEISSQDMTCGNGYKLEKLSLIIIIISLSLSLLLFLQQS